MDALGSELLRQARAAIGEALGGPPCPLPAGLTELTTDGATFVTLMLRSQLRGCIGSLQAHRPLIADVRANAVAAAMNDPRFYPVEAEELPKIRVEISLLSPPESIEFNNERELLETIIPGKDGLVISNGTHRATFLPQVWDQLPEPKEFLARLIQKAGLPSDTPIETLKVQRYRVDKWKEE